MFLNLYPASTVEIIWIVSCYSFNSSRT